MTQKKRVPSKSAPATTTRSKTTANKTTQTGTTPSEAAPTATTSSTTPGSARSSRSKAAPSKAAPSEAAPTTPTSAKATGSKTAPRASAPTRPAPIETAASETAPTTPTSCETAPARSTSPTTGRSGHGRRIVMIGLLLALAAFGIDRYAVASNSNAEAALGGPVVTDVSGQTTSGGGGAAPSAGGGCCSGGGTSTPVEGTAAVTGGVQAITVNVGATGYEPNVVKLKAGVPAEITFGQSGGCTGYVQSQQLNFGVDVGSGPQTVKLPALQPGTYGFACGMGMVAGQIVVS